MWVADTNFQSHRAHKRRADGGQGPAEVPGWVGGKQYVPEELGETEWLGVIRVPGYAPRGRRALVGARSSLPLG